MTKAEMEKQLKEQQEIIDKHKKRIKNLFGSIIF